MFLPLPTGTGTSLAREDSSEKKNAVKLANSQTGINATARLILIKGSLYSFATSQYHDTWTEYPR
jgi:hypothetical protein